MEYTATHYKHYCLVVTLQVKTQTLLARRITTFPFITEPLISQVKYNEIFVIITSINLRFFAIMIIIITTMGLNELYSRRPSYTSRLLSRVVFYIYGEQTKERWKSRLKSSCILHTI